VGIGQTGGQSEQFEYAAVLQPQSVGEKLSFMRSGIFDDPFRRPGEISVPQLGEAPKFSSQSLDMNGLVSAPKHDSLPFSQSLGDPLSFFQMGSPDENRLSHHEAPPPPAGTHFDERLGMDARKPDERFVDVSKPVTDVQPPQIQTYPESRNESLVEEQQNIPPIPTTAPPGVDTGKIKELASTWWDFSDLNRTGFLTFPDVACIVRQLHYTFGATAPDAPSLRGIIKQYSQSSNGSEEIAKSDFLVMYLNLILAETNAMLPRKDS
jgi:hypothetical protein